MFFTKERVKSLPPRRPADYAIKLTLDTLPLFLPLCLLFEKELKILQEWLKESLAFSQIVPSKSPAGILIFFTLKKDGTLWLYIDYRVLNKITVKNCYPLSLVSKILNRLSNI